VERYEKKVTVTIPPGVRDGMRTDILLDAEGMFKRHLVVTVRTRQVSIKVHH
jgi:hypothetical protein